MRRTTAEDARNEGLSACLAHGDEATCPYPTRTLLASAWMLGYGEAKALMYDPSGVDDTDDDLWPYELTT